MKQRITDTNPIARAMRDTLEEHGMVVTTPEALDLWLETRLREVQLRARAEALLEAYNLCVGRSAFAMSKIYDLRDKALERLGDTSDGPHPAELDYVNRIEQVAECMWRGWVSENGGDITIPWSQVAVKPYWRQLARNAIAAVEGSKDD